jgi:hypothetical protein
MYLCGLELRINNPYDLLLPPNASPLPSALLSSDLAKLFGLLRTSGISPVKHQKHYPSQSWDLCELTFWDFYLCDANNTADRPHCSWGVSLLVRKIFLLTSWRRKTSQPSSIHHGKFQYLSSSQSKQPQKTNFHSEVSMALNMSKIDVNQQ